MRLTVSLHTKIWLSS